MVNLIEEIQIEEENIKKLNEEKDVFLETKEIIESSYEEMKNNVTPKFNICLSEYIDKIYCIVRPKAETSVKKRLYDKIKFYFNNNFVI